MPPLKDAASVARCAQACAARCRRRKGAALKRGKHTTIQVERRLGLDMREGSLAIVERSGLRGFASFSKFWRSGSVAPFPSADASLGSRSLGAIDLPVRCAT